MYQDGVCRLDLRSYSKCIEFSDTNYQLAQPDDRTATFEYLCDLYNYVDASIHVQFSFVNRRADPAQYARSFEIAPQGDDFDDIRAEYTGILQRQLTRGNNGIVKTKYLTFTIEADNLKAARARLERIETDLLGYFKMMGAAAHVLDGAERLEVLHGVFHPDGELFRFDWKWLPTAGLSTKDFIAPSSLRFGNSRIFGIGGKYGAVSFLQILAPELSDEMLADFLNTENGIVVNLHVQAIEQTEAIKRVKRKITDLDAMKIQEQKKAVRSGYDMDILPSDLATYGTDAKQLLSKLQTRNERLFMVTFLVLNMADTQRKLSNEVFRAAGVAQKYNCALVRLDDQQEQGLMASLPLGQNHINIQRGLTTSSTAIFVPFVTQELFQGGGAMYYGVNAKTHNMIMLDRKLARCPNGLKLGTPGSGKSMSCKSEMPVLSDLHAALTAQHIPEADRVAQALDLYVSGSLNVFNHRTNVDIENRLVCFDIKDLGKQLKKLGMLIVQDQIWGRVTANRSMGKATWYFADEFHLLLKEEQTAAYSAEIWKRFRKWGGIPTGATQNVKDLLSSPEIENILENSDFITLLNQASGDRKILAERLNLSPDHQKYIDNSEPGAGLLIFENVILPFTNPIPSNTELYKIMTTRLSEVVEGGA